MRLFGMSKSTALMAAVALVVSASAASAFSLRSPQIVFNYAPLQGYFTSVGEGINVATDQLDAQVWQSSVSGNTTFTLMFELTGNIYSNAIGVYNADPTNPSPTLYQVFPGAASAGWFATCHFTSTGTLLVYLYDDTGTFQGLTSYSGVDRTKFGFYIQSPLGLWYSQDWRNTAAGNAQILTYAGTGQNYGDWWECFESYKKTLVVPTYTGAVVLLQSVAPTPTANKTWGQLKATYR